MQGQLSRSNIAGATVLKSTSCGSVEFGEVRTRIIQSIDSSSTGTSCLKQQIQTVRLDAKGFGASGATVREH